MKLFLSLALIALLTIAVYFCLTKKPSDKKYNNISRKKAIMISATICIILVGTLAYLMYKSATAPDMQCTTVHTTSLMPPKSLASAMDYYLQGNYDYETGNCQKAIVNFNASIQLDPNYPQAYNNRAYTFMRMQNYKDALSDLDKAIALNPNYINALMNRGDIHNYYYAIDRKSSTEDYEKVISLGGEKDTSVCGHLLLAKHDGWNLGTLLALHQTLYSCN